MKNSQKIIFGLFFIVLTLVVSGYFSVFLITKIARDTDIITKQEYPLNESISNYQRGSFQLWVGTYTYGNDSVMGQQIIKNGKNLMERSRQELAGMINDLTIKELWEKEKSAITSSDTLLESYDEKNIQEASNSTTTPSYENQIKFNSSLLQQKVNSLNFILSTMVDESQENINKQIAIVNAENNRAISTAIIATIIACFLALLVGLFIIISIVRPLNELNKVTDFITNGNFDAKLPIVKNKEMANLIASIEMLLSVVKAKKTK